MKKLPIVSLLLYILLVTQNIFIVSCPDDDDDVTPTHSPTITPTGTPTHTPTITPTVTQTPIPEIIPGEKLFDLYIGDMFQTCLDLYGLPNGTNCQDGLCSAIYYNPYFQIGMHDINNNLELDSIDTIYAICITDHTPWQGKTAGGNGIGSSKNSVIEEFGPCEINSPEECLYPSIGIDWGFIHSTAFCDILIVDEIE